MKNYILILVICLISTLGFSQNIVWEKSYDNAVKQVRSNKAVLLIYFFDGENSGLERKIKKDILKSSALKSTMQNIVILEVEDKDNDKQDPYFTRLKSSYNTDNVFPALAATKPSTAKSTDLLTKFDVNSVSMFIKQIKNL